MAHIIEAKRAKGAGLSFGIVVARFNVTITEQLLQGALEGLRERGVADDSITVVWVPGAFEIPLVARHLAESRRFDALICLGCVIKGETHHFELVISETASGVAKLSYEYRIPAVFEVLAVEDFEVAMDRAGRKLNRGRDAAETAVEMANLMPLIQELEPKA